MGITIEQFGSECRAILKADPGPDGVERVRRRLEDVLVDADFVARHLGPDNTETRKILYQDVELGFCILDNMKHSLVFQFGTLADADSFANRRLVFLQNGVAESAHKSITLALSEKSFRLRRYSLLAALGLGVNLLLHLYLFSALFRRLMYLLSFRALLGIQ